MHFDRNLLKCLYAVGGGGGGGGGGRGALSGFIFGTFVGHIFKVTMRQAWQ